VGLFNCLLVVLQFAGGRRGSTVKETASRGATTTNETERGR